MNLEATAEALMAAIRKAQPLTADPDSDLVAALKAQHEAIDILLATCAANIKGFMPSKSAAWPLMREGHKALVAAGIYT